MAAKLGREILRYGALMAIFLLIPAPSFARQHIVGDGVGWTLPSFGHVNYTVWASNRTFHVGDSLLFNYRPDIHNVLSVTGSDYEACSTPNHVTTFDDGKTTISLTDEGPSYFICGVPGHCGQGQKLSIMVLPATDESSHPVASPSSSGTSNPNSDSPVNGTAAAGGPFNSAIFVGSCIFLTSMLGMVGAVLNILLLQLL